MSAILLKPFDTLTQRDFTIAMPSIKTRGLLFIFSGVNSTGTPLTRSDFGRVQIMRDGKQPDSEITFEHIDALRLKYMRSEVGTPIFSSTGSSNVQASFYLPLFAPGDREQVDEFSDRAMLRIIHADLSALASSLQCQVYYVPALGVKKYELNYTDFSMETDSALVVPRRKVPANDVLYLGVDYSANHTNIRLNKDGKQVYDISATDLNSLSSPADIFNSLECVYPADTYAEASSNYVPYLLRLNETGEETALSDNVTISVVSASATFTGFVASLTYRPATIVASAENYAAKVAKNRARRG